MTTVGMCLDRPTQNCIKPSLSLEISIRNRIESAIMRLVVLPVISMLLILNQSIFNCLITSASTLLMSSLKNK